MLPAAVLADLPDSVAVLRAALNGIAVRDEP